MSTPLATWAVVLAQPEMDRANWTVLYVVGAAAVVVVALWIWRLFRRSKTFGRDHYGPQGP